MSESFSRPQLEQMRVADLRNIAETYAIDFDNMKKADLVDAILHAEDEDIQELVDYVPESDSDNQQVVANDQQENADLDASGEDSTVDIDASLSPDVEADTEIDHPDIDEPCAACMIKQAVTPKELPTLIRGIKSLYSSDKCDHVVARVSGRISVISETQNAYKIRCFISGYGPKVGYIKK